MADQKIQIPEDPQEGLPPVTPLDPEPFPDPPAEEAEAKEAEGTPETADDPEREAEPALPQG